MAGSWNRVRIRLDLTRILIRPIRNNRFRIPPSRKTGSGIDSKKTRLHQSRKAGYCFDQMNLNPSWKYLSESVIWLVDVTAVVRALLALNALWPMLKRNGGILLFALFRGRSQKKVGENEVKKCIKTLYVDRPIYKSGRKIKLKI